jgi:hypothetical protein
MPAGSSIPPPTPLPLTIPLGLPPNPSISATILVSYEFPNVNARVNIFQVFVKLIFFSVFKTSSNQTVIQTYNLTTFKNCSIDDTSYTDTFVYNGGNTVFNQAFTIIVPLTIQGPNYFFSDASDGIQCQHGLAFDINVSRGLGLPPSLNQPPPPPYREPPGPDSAYPPITIPAKGEGAGNSGFKNGVSVQVIACVSLFALLAVNVGDRGGIF